MVLSFFMASLQWKVCNCVFFSLCACLQARNIAVCIEFRDSDDEDAVSLKVNPNLLAADSMGLTFQSPLPLN